MNEILGFPIVYDDEDIDSDPIEIKLLPFDTYASTIYVYNSDGELIEIRYGGEDNEQV